MLVALVRGHQGEAPAPELSHHPGGATLRSGRQGWVLVEDDPSRALGRALAWGWQNGAADLHLVLTGDPGIPARRAGLLDTVVTVWGISGRDLVPAVPAPRVVPPPPPPQALALAPALERAGAHVVVEHGEVVGEVLGLEVARVVVAGTGEARIEVGVGRHDREAFAMLHGDLPTDEALAAVIGSVLRHRTAGGPSHPLRSLAGERWLRHRLIAEPAMVGAASLRAAEGPAPRPGVKQAQPAVAVGVSAGNGSPVVVVTSVGVDLELVPYAADARAVYDDSARLVLVLPARDALPVTRALAALTRPPAEVVAVEGDWRSEP